MPKQKAWATTYYVDAANGADGNSGTSQTSPWRTLTRATTTLLAPGDTILLKRGCIWHELLYLDQAGNSNAWLTIGAYGSGALPVVTGADSVTSTAAFRWSLSAHGANEYYLEKAGGGNPGVTEPNLVWVNQQCQSQGDTLGSLADHQWRWGDNDALGFSTLYFRDDSGNPNTLGLPLEAGSRNAAAGAYNAAYVRFEDLELRQGNFPWSGAAYVGRSSQVQFNRCVIHDGYLAVVNIYTTTPLPEYIQLTDCTLYGARSHNARTGAVVNCNGTHCTFLRCRVFDTSRDGISFWSQATDNVVDSCTLTGPAWTMVSIGDRSHRNTVQYNYFSGADSLDVYVEDSDNIQIRYNIFYESSHLGGVYFIGLAETCDDALIENNTLYLDQPNAGGLGFEKCARMQVRNNLLRTGNNTTALYLDNASKTGFAADHNLYWNPYGSLILWGSAAYASGQFSAYQSDTGQDAHSKAADPGLAAPSTGDFRLLFGSPAIDAGLSLGYTRDYAGNGVPQNSLPDIGALEYLPAARMTSLAWVQIPFATFYNNTQNNLIGQIQARAVGADTLLSLNVENLGSASGNTDLASVQAWLGDQPVFDPLLAQPLGAFSWLDPWHARLALNHTVRDGQYLYLTADILEGATTGATCRFSLPAGGAIFQTASPLPPAALSNSAVQVIQRSSLLSLSASPPATRNAVFGASAVPLGELAWNNASGQDLNFNSFEIQVLDENAVPLAPSAFAARLWLEENGAVIAALAPPFGTGTRFTFNTPYALPNQARRTWQLFADLAPSPSARKLQAVIPSAQCVNWGQISITAPGQLFPLGLDQVHLRAPDLSATFHSYPNPFQSGRESASISYYLPQAGSVVLEVRTLNGELVKTLVSGDQRKGMQQVHWEGENGRGQAVRSGVFFLNLKIHYTDGSNAQLARKIAITR